MRRITQLSVLLAVLLAASLASHSAPTEHRQHHHRHEHHHGKSGQGEGTTEDHLSHSHTSHHAQQTLVTIPFVRVRKARETADTTRLQHHHHHHHLETGQNNATGSAETQPGEYDVPTRNDHEVQYMINFIFGAQEQQRFTLVMDTGSSDLWVPAAENKGFRKSIKGFECDAQDCKLTSQHFAVDYDDGPISGYVAFTDVTIDGVNLTIPKQSFLLVDKANDAMRFTPGILGLGPPLLAVNQNPQPIEHMRQLGLITQSVFSLYLSIEEGDKTSRLVIGGIDEQYIQSGQEIVYTPILSRYEYTISVEKVLIGSHEAPVGKALIDSGTSCITFPAAHIDALVPWFEAHALQCYFVVEKYSPDYSMMFCRGAVENFPQIQFVLGGRTLTLSAQDYLYGCRGTSPDSVTCETKLERSKIDDVLILGDAFLQSFYVVIDQDAWRIGLAHSINSAKIKIRAPAASAAAFNAALVAAPVPEQQNQHQQQQNRHHQGNNGAASARASTKITYYHQAAALAILGAYAIAFAVVHMMHTRGRIPAHKYTNTIASINIVLVFSLLALVTTVHV